MAAAAHQQNYRTKSWNDKSQEFFQSQIYSAGNREKEHINDIDFVGTKLNPASRKRDCPLSDLSGYRRSRLSESQCQSLHLLRPCIR